MYRPTYKVCSLPHQVQTTSLLKLTIRVHMSCPRDISRKTRSSTGSWSANCRGRLGFLFTRTQNCRVCPSSRVESYYFGGAKKAGLENCGYTMKKRRVWGSTRELGERVNTVNVAIKVIKIHEALDVHQGKVKVLLKRMPKSNLKMRDGICWACWMLS